MVLPHQWRGFTEWLNIYLFFTMTSGWLYNIYVPVTCSKSVCTLGGNSLNKIASKDHAPTFVLTSGFSVVINYKAKGNQVDVLTARFINTQPMLDEKRDLKFEDSSAQVPKRGT